MTDTGHIGEAIAAKYYQQRGWLLLNHNYRTRMGEIDLILYKDDTLVFAEVKTRYRRDAGSPGRCGGCPQAAAIDFSRPAVFAVQPLPGRSRPL